MRPCDLCGGDGIGLRLRTYTTEEVQLCSRCVDMPKLPVKLLETIWSSRWPDGWFKPDPDSIIRWCLTHNCVAWTDSSSACKLAACEDWRIEGDCDLGWVARPERLETIE